MRDDADGSGRRAGRAGSPVAGGRRSRLGPGGEFDLIRELLAVRGADLPGGVEVGPGDDAAVLEAGGGERVVLTCDMAVEGVHFRRDWLEPGEIGYRAAAAALSDLAAMAAEPRAVLVAYAFAPDDRARVGRAVHEGVQEACSAAGAAVVGGDVTRSSGPLVVDVTAVGRLGPDEEPVLRSGARAGDEVWVTGTLGGAGAAVRLLLDGAPVPEPLREAYAHPIPRIREARWLRRRIPLHALIDLSDGLAGDAGHVAAASGVTVVLDAARVPVGAGVAEAMEGRVGAGRAGVAGVAGVAGEDGEAGDVGHGLAQALHGGEDYELCFAAPPGVTERVVDDFREAFSLPLTRVGRVTEASGEGGGGVLLDEGRAGGPRPLDRGGWDHFGGNPGADRSRGGEGGRR